jgi:hypothetical protein
VVRADAPQRGSTKLQNFGGEGWVSPFGDSLKTGAPRKRDSKGGNQGGGFGGSALNLWCFRFDSSACIFLPGFIICFQESFGGAYVKTLVKLPKTITFSLPSDAGEEIKAVAKKEHRSVSELLLDTFNRYQAKKEFHELAARTQKYVKKKKLTPKDFGGPFAE